MSSSSFEMRSAGMASGLVVLLELGAGFPLGIDVMNDAVGVLNGKATISPRMIFERHDDNQTRSGGRRPVRLTAELGLLCRFIKVRLAREPVEIVLPLKLDQESIKIRR